MAETAATVALIAAVEAVGPAYAAAVAGASGAVAKQTRQLIARRLASSGAARLIGDPAVARIGKVGITGRAGISDMTSEAFAAAVGALFADAE